MPMKAKSYRLINTDVAQNCFNAIHQAVKDNQGTPHNVVVTIGIDNDKARSLAQNRIYWSWLHELEQQTGHETDFWHCYFKRLFLARIYARDDGEFAQMADSIKRCQGIINQTIYEQMAMGVVNMISTTTASTKQFSEYLTKIETWAVANGFKVTTPQELEWVR